jgi:hypothetical protein
MRATTHTALSPLGTAELDRIEGGLTPCEAIDAIVKFVKGLLCPPQPPVGDFNPAPNDIA